MYVRKLPVFIVTAAAALGLFWFGAVNTVQAQCGIGGTVTAPPAGRSSAPTDPLGAFLGTGPASSGQSGSPGENPLANGVVGLVAAALIAGGGGYVLANERRKQSLAARGLSGAAGAALPGLAQLSPDGLEALDAILEDPQQAAELFLALVDLDLETLKDLPTGRRKHALAEALAGGVQK